jgi:hypothetical protein
VQNISDKFDAASAKAEEPMIGSLVDLVLDLREALAQVLCPDLRGARELVFRRCYHKGAGQNCKVAQIHGGDRNRRSAVPVQRSRPRVRL